jgi:hypothetical protein
MAKELSIFSHAFLLLLLLLLPCVLQGSPLALEA